MQWAYSKFASTNVQSGIELGLIPLAGAVLLSIWWLAASRARWLDRMLGYALFLVAITCVVASQENASYGAMLLAYAVPAITTGMVLVFLATTRLRWPIRSWLVAGYMTGCCALHLAMRVESVGGNLAPEVSWRWKPSRMERSGAMARREAHGTATLPAQAGPGDYPAFRGPARDGKNFL